jgi:hypothetical protein
MLEVPLLFSDPPGKTVVLDDCVALPASSIVIGFSKDGMTPAPVVR